MKILKVLLVIGVVALGASFSATPAYSQISCEDLPDGCPDQAD